MSCSGCGACKCGKDEMTIYPVTVVRKFALVHTDREGSFQVWDDGTMKRWTDDDTTGQGDYAWFDETKYTAQHIEDIRMAGLTAIENAK